MIKLATVSPCYNEEEVLRHSVERLTALFERMITEKLISSDSMMVFVNDGSRDGSMKILRAIAAENPHVKVRSFSRNFGHQLAVTCGMDHAKGDALIIIDVDLQDPPELIPKRDCVI